MSYKVLKEWTTRVGLLAAVIKIDMGHNCGYVGIKGSHPLYGKQGDEHVPCLVPLLEKVKNGEIGKRGIIPVICHQGKATMDFIFNVHGGVTFSRTAGDYPITTKGNIHWIGFDCAHAGDNPIRCDLNYCISECEDLAGQLFFVGAEFRKAEG